MKDEKRNRVFRIKNGNGHLHPSSFRLDPYYLTGLVYDLYGTSGNAGVEP